MTLKEVALSVRVMDAISEVSTINIDNVRVLVRFNEPIANARIQETQSAIINGLEMNAEKDIVFSWNFHHTDLLLYHRPNKEVNSLYPSLFMDLDKGEACQC